MSESCLHGISLHARGIHRHSLTTRAPLLPTISILPRRGWPRWLHFRFVFRLKTIATELSWLLGYWRLEHSATAGVRCSLNRPSTLMVLTAGTWETFVPLSNETSIIKIEHLNQGRALLRRPALIQWEWVRPSELAEGPWTRSRPRSMAALTSWVRFLTPSFPNKFFV